MSTPFNESDFRDMVKQTLAEARESAKNIVLREHKDEMVEDLKRLLESGDEFGDAFSDTGWKDFTKILGDPGKVKDAVVGSALKVGAKAQTLLSVVLRGIPSLVIPFIKTHYDQIYAREKSQLDRIRQKYPDVFKNAGQLFTGDAKLAAFMINPVLMTSAVAAQGSVDVVLGLTNALGAGDRGITDQVRQIWRHVNRLPASSASIGKSSRIETTPERKGNEDLYYTEGFLHEATQAQRLAVKLLRNKQFQQKLGHSHVVQDLKKMAETVKNETLNELIKFAQDIRQVEDIEGLKAMAPDLAQKIQQQLQRLSPGEQESVLRTTIQQVKNDSILALTEKMKEDIATLQKLQVPSASEMISAYEKALSEISAMASSG